MWDSSSRSEAESSGSIVASVVAMTGTSSRRDPGKSVAVSLRTLDAGRPGRLAVGFTHPGPLVSSSRTGLALLTVRIDEGGRPYDHSHRPLQSDSVPAQGTVERAHVAQIVLDVVNPMLRSSPLGERGQIAAEPRQGLRLLHQVVHEEPALRVAEEHPKGLAGLEDRIVSEEFLKRDPVDHPLGPGKVFEPPQVDPPQLGRAVHLPRLAIQADPFHDAE